MPKLYGRRKGKKLRAHHCALMAELLPRLAIDLAGAPIAPAALFGRPYRELHLEIGFGDGARLIQRAAENPDAAFIGCEPFVNGVAKALALIESRRIENVRLCAGDARELLPLLPDGSFDLVEILYPDPWPKRRQKKRRIVSDDFLDLLAAKMRPGATLRFASDDDDYCGWILARIARGRHFRWIAERPANWRVPWAGWVSTRYEAKARAEGRKSSYLTFIRR